MAFNSIEDYIRNLEFKKTAFGGVDQEDVLNKMRALISLFQKEAEQMRLRGGSSTSDLEILKVYEEKLSGTEKELADAKAKIARSDKRLAEAAAWIHEASGKMAKYQAKLAEYEAGMAESAEKLSAYAGRLAEAENKLAEYESTPPDKVDLKAFEARWNEELDTIREECRARIEEIENDYAEKLKKVSAPKTIRIAADSVRVNVMPRENAELS